MRTSDSLQEFQALLRDLFQFDVADLDFGVYRILNEKRDDIERFIEEDLVDGVREELEAYEAGKTEEIRGDLEAKKSEIRAALGANALLPDGSISDEYKDTPLAQEYRDLQEDLEAASLSVEAERRIYDDLARFFNRYYDSGDFVTKRRFAAGDSRYYVPYDGEEVLLHWANRDQYYVKTTEHFRDYRFSVRGVDVHFQLVDAQVRQDNVKASDTRYFVLHGADPVAVDAEANTCTIRFAYRPITEEEDERLLERYNEIRSKSTPRRTNDRSTIVAATSQQILDAIDDATVQANLGQPEEGKETSPLRQHLNRYTEKHKADYFVHKDLSGFLRGQLEFFIQNEVLQLDDVLEASEQRRTHQVDRAKVVKKIGQRIIDFLAQIEDFQKRLFEKKKFVVDTGYCVTLDRVPDALYDEILDNTDQLDEWRDLYSVEEWENGLFSQGYENGAFTRDFLEAHPYVMIDTRHFDRPFVDTLLNHLSDLDDEGLSAVVDGLCIHGENFQALNLLLERFKEKVNCVYIDPPFNTENDEFLYKDNYQHSSWLSMMADRLAVSRPLLSENALVFLSIDDVEQHTLRSLGSSIYGNFIANVVWQSRQSVDSRSETSLSNDHEFVLTYGKSLRGSLKDMEKFDNPDEDNRGPWRDADMTGLATEERRPNLHFDILLGEVGGGESADELLTINGWRVSKPTASEKGRTNKGEIEVGRIVLALGEADPENTKFDAQHLVGVDDVELLHVNGTPADLADLPYFFGCPPKGWRFEPPRMAEKMEEGRVLLPNKKGGRPRHKLFRDEMDSLYKGFSSVLQTITPYEVEREGDIDPEAKVYTSDGTRELNDLFGREVIQFPKPTELIRTLIEQQDDKDSIVLDFFAGAGPTGESVMQLNDQSEESNRKYILVEVGDHFDAALIPRLKKSAFTCDWDEGVPESLNGQSQVIKYHRLESYEDALNNIKVEEPDTELDLMDRFDDYALHYMLPTETRGSETLLAPEAFEKPFDYTLRIQHGMESPTAREVDLESTFNYLIGLEVETRRVYKHQGQRYVVVTGQVERGQSIDKVMVVWRNREDLDLVEEKEWAAESLPDGPFDTVYVNGPSHIHGKAEPTEIVFRERMEPDAV